MHALGGTGLMALCGLDVPVKDWDLTTHHDAAAVKAVLSRYDPRSLERVEPFRSRYAYRFRVGHSSVDVLGGFAVWDGASIVHCRTVITGHHGDIPLGSPAEWAKAYRALGYHAKADRLDRLARSSDRPA